MSGASRISAPIRHADRFFIYGLNQDTEPKGEKP
jgi:hypothetical protein